MNFLNPPVLLGLFAISIPILIHLLNLRKLRKIEFSTLMFLKEVQKSKMKKIKLKQLILLLLRIFIICFLVMCFAKPVYEGYAGNKDSGSNSLVLIFIDDSFSMTARDNNGSYLNQAKDAAKDIVKLHKESDDIYLIPVSKIAIKKQKVLFNNFKEILDSLEQVKISYKSFSINEALNYSDQILSDSKRANKEIFIISDFQKGNFGSGVLSEDKFRNLHDKSLNTYLVKIGKREVSNISLDSFVIVSKILERDKDIKVKIFLNNHSPYNVRNKTVNLYVNDELRGEKVVDVNSFEKKEIEFIFKSNTSGNLKGTIELVQNEFQDDEIIQDNKFYFSLYIPDKFNIGLLVENPKDFYFINLALQTASNMLSDSLKKKSSLFNISSEKAITNDIFKNGILFISNKKSFTDNEADILKNYISSGRGVFLFLGNSVDVNNYNSTILNKLNSVSIRKLNIDKDINSNLQFDKVDFENPVLSEVFLNPKLNITANKSGIESPKIKSYFELLTSENTNSIITLTNGQPFLLETKVSGGKIIISSVSATDDFTDFPLNTIFAPLIIRSVYYLSNNFDFQKTSIIGNSNILSVKGISNVSDIILPDRSVIKSGITFNTPGENYIILPYSENMSEIGNYTIKDSTGNNSFFSLNNSPLESNPSTLSKEEIIEYFKQNKIQNVKFIDDAGNIPGVVNQSGEGLSLWKYFLIGAVLLLIAEQLLSKKLEDS